MFTNRGVVNAVVAAVVVDSKVVQYTKHNLWEITAQKQQYLQSLTMDLCV